MKRKIPHKMYSKARALSALRLRRAHALPIEERRKIIAAYRAKRRAAPHTSRSSLSGGVHSNVVAPVPIPVANTAPRSVSSFISALFGRDLSPVPAHGISGVGGGAPISNAGKAGIVGLSPVPAHGISGVGGGTPIPNTGKAGIVDLSTVPARGISNTGKVGIVGAPRNTLSAGISPVVHGLGPAPKPDPVSLSPGLSKESSDMVSSPAGISGVDLSGVMPDPGQRPTSAGVSIFPPSDNEAEEIIRTYREHGMSRSDIMDILVARYGGKVARRYERLVNASHGITPSGIR